MSGLILSFQSDWLCQEESEGTLLLQSPTLKLTLKQLSQGLLQAIKLLGSGGAAEGELTQLVATSDGSSALPKLYYYLQQLRGLGAICHSLKLNGSPLAIAVPMTAPYTWQFSPAEPDRAYQLSRFAYCHSQNSQLVVESPLSATKLFLPDWRGAALLSEIARPQTAHTLTKIPGISEGTAQQFLSLLLTVGIVSPVAESGVRLEENNKTLATWEFHDLLFHTRSRSGRHDRPSGKTFRLLDTVDPTPVLKPQVSQEYIDLFKPDIPALKTTDYPFTWVLEARKSVRTQGEPPITDRQLGEFLYRSARVRAIFPKDRMECSNRPYPNGGACYELELYLAVNRCDRLPSGFYHYCPHQHRLGKIAEKNDSVERLLRSAALSVGMEGEPQIAIVLATRFPRVSWGYESIAYSLTLKHVGVLYQTFYLVATAMNLASCAVGGGDSDLFAAVTGCDYYAESSVGEFLLGSQPH